MKIKIPPYPNFGIVNDLFDKLKVNSVETDNSEPLTDKLLMVTEFEGGKKRVIRARPIRYKRNLYVSAFPNPVHLFLSNAIELYELSESTKRTNFPKCGRRYGKDVFILDIEENGTHTCYNNYIKYRASSIVMMVSSIEAFLNHVIPNNFIYKTIRKRKEVEFNKVEIESPKVSFKEKMTNVIQQYLEQTDQNPNLEKEQKVINSLYLIRKDIIHLKTNAEDDFSAYFNQIDDMLNLDIGTSIDEIINYMNKVKPNFIKFE